MLRFVIIQTHVFPRIDKEKTQHNLLLVSIISPPSVNESTSFFFYRICKGKKLPMMFMIHVLSQAQKFINSRNPFKKKKNFCH